MRSIPLALLLPGALGAALACAEGPAPIEECEARGAARPVCGFHNPEDLTLLPDGHSVLVSEYGGMESGGSGALALYDLGSDARRVLFRAGDVAQAAAGPWGDAACPGPPSAGFSPHGIDLAPRPDGKLQLLVVQHAGRESVEMFEAIEEQGSWRLEWRGCAVAPPDSWLNEVVALPAGGFLVTHMLARSRGMDSLRELMAAGNVPNTGYALEWQPGSGFAKAPGTDSPVPNGIEVSADGQKIFLNVSGNHEVWRIDRRSGQVEARAQVRAGDNSTWAPDGRLLVASVRADPAEFTVCLGLTRGACPLEFAIVAVDPVSMRADELYRNAGPPMGGGTVGLQVGDELLIGSFAGDRILRVKLGGAGSPAP